LVDNYPREFDSIGRNITFYMKRSDFELRTLHFSIIKTLTIIEFRFLNYSQSLLNDLNFFIVVSTFFVLFEVFYFLFYFFQIVCVFYNIYRTNSFM